MKRIPRLLLVAFALSLLVHLVVAIGLRPAAPTPATQSEVVSIQHRPATIAVRKPPTPPPSPPPQRTPAPRTAASAPPRKGPGEGGTQGASAATPVPVVAQATAKPAVTPTAGCAHSNSAAAVVSTPAPPEIPLSVRASGTSGTALVSVQLDTSGTVTGASVTQSTGNSSLDLVAVGMARDARYSPALHDCKPVASAYVYSVKFVAW
ncbi:MAG: TonB family protein [Candidatus Eremiobacteraeota bacterium]|nr:TonB family protein [Candidatus Eremiobacteraeota bacterium]